MQGGFAQFCAKIKICGTCCRGLSRSAAVGAAAAAVLPAGPIVLAGEFLQPEDFAAAIPAKQIRDMGRQIAVAQQIFSDVRFRDDGLHPAGTAFETVNARIIKSIAVHADSSLSILISRTHNGFLNTYYHIMRVK